MMKTETKIKDCGEGNARKGTVTLLKIETKIRNRGEDNLRKGKGTEKLMKTERKIKD